MDAYGIGLDVGISSVGWSVVGLQGKNERPYCILGMGSRIFPPAENPKTGASLAAPRREKRGQRRRLRRQRFRNQRIRELLTEKKIISQEQLNTLFTGQLSDIYELRVKALDDPVAPCDFARILIHLSQRRGFRSNRKNATSKEDGELLKAVHENTDRMQQNGYRTAAEMFLKDPLFTQHKRNVDGDYLTTVTRDMVEGEARRIFFAQRSFGRSFASEDIEEAYLSILLGQRSFDEGPGSGSPYGGAQILKMIGKCTFFPEEYRAAKACYSFEYFSLLEKVNHITLIDTGGHPRSLTPEERQTILDMARRSEKVTYAQIRKKLNLSEYETFNMVRPSKDKTVEEAEKKEELKQLSAYHKIRKVLEKRGIAIGEIPVETLDAVGNAFSIYKTQEKIEEYLRENGVEESLIRIFGESDLSFSKFGHLSLKACRALIPYLEEGKIYNEACEAAGINFHGHSGIEKTFLLHPTEEDYADITSPVSKRAIAQTIKVINAIIRKQGCSPTYIHVELAREMAHNFQDRVKIDKRMKDNRAANERDMQIIRDQFHKQTPSGMDLLKLRLYREQDGICAYHPAGPKIAFDRLFEPNYVEIDHIVPYSISYDDSFNNKVLVFAKDNREKGNRLPLQYLSGKEADDFLVWVNCNVKNPRKKNNLLKEDLSEEEALRFRERNLQDTKTISRFLLNYINDHLLFGPSEFRKKRVTAVNGSITAYLRKRWGIEKNRAAGDKHHAVDALVIACVTDPMINIITRFIEYNECRNSPFFKVQTVIDPDTGETIVHFPEPWESFQQDLTVWKERVFVSRMPNRKVSGPAHEDTYKGVSSEDPRQLIHRVPLTKLKLDKFGEIANYYRPEQDLHLYQALRKRLREFDGKAEEAFTEPFRKPDNPERIVKKVRVAEPSSLNVEVLKHKGRADNGSMIRVDVFHAADGYYLVPIYVADTRKPELPNKAIVSGKPYEQWKEMRPEDFLFSLYPNDLICIENKKKIIELKLLTDEANLPNNLSGNKLMLYFRGADIATASITVTNDDHTYGKRGFGVKTLSAITKYEVDVLGEYHPVKSEKRQGFSNKKGKA